MKLIFLLILVLIKIDSSCQESPITLARNTSYGYVRGLRFNEFNVTLDVFKGIPYASPPLEDLRFRPPKRPRSWGGVLNTFYENEDCIQNSGGSEDCLYLNVYTPYLGDKFQPSLPVIVWIHGGGFTTGYGDKHLEDKEFIAKSNSVFVTFNYRLGAFGFLNCKSIPGNMGLLDQVMALNWVSENIGWFGGDRSKVTLMGYSAGAASVDYHSVNPETSLLFHRRILLSGSANAPWAFMSPGDAALRCHRLLANLGCAKNHEECLAKKTNAEILLATEAIPIDPIKFHFVPSIDGKLIRVPPDHPNFRSKQVAKDTIAVTNRDEGSIFIRLCLKGFMTEEEESIKFNLMEKAIKTMSLEYNEKKFNKILNEYTEDRNIFVDDQATIVVSNYISDKYFQCPLIDAMDNQKDKNSSSYLFHFTHLHEVDHDYKVWLGVRHNSFILFLFGSTESEKFSEKEKKAINSIRSKIIDFVSSRKIPNIEFKDGYTELSLEEKKISGRHPREKFCKLLKTKIDLLSNSNDINSTSNQSLFDHNYKSYSKLYFYAVFSIFIVATLIIMKSICNHLLRLKNRTIKLKN